MISTHFTKIAGWEWGSLQFTKYCFAVPQPFFNSIVHLHHNLAKAVYRAENYRNLVELLVSDKADLITILVHFCYPRDWQFSDKPCRFNRFFGDSRNSVSGKSIWHHHRTRWYQSNVRLHIWNTFRDQRFRSHGFGATTGFGTPSLTGGFGTPALGSSTGGSFGSTGTGLGGTGFGTGTSAFTAQPKFQLQRQPAGNKRGKRR